MSSLQTKYTKIYDEMVSYLRNIPNLDKKKILDVGCGNAMMDNLLLKNGVVSEIDGIDNSLLESFMFDKELSRHKKFTFIDGDFMNYEFNKTYDVLMFGNSLQFILDMNPNNIDKTSSEAIFNKMVNLLNEDGHIFIKVTTKEWFKNNK